MKPAPISATLSLLLMMCSAAPCATAQSKGAFRPVHGTVRVDRSNLPYDLTIEPSKMAAESTSIETGGDAWIARGYDLKTLLSQIFNLDARRIEFGEGISEGRYDVTLNLPREVDEETMQHLLASALEQKFGLKITPESRTMDVYVMSAPEGPRSNLHAHTQPARLKAVSQDSADTQDEGRITYMGKDCTETGSATGITVSGGTIADFQRTLEPDLDRVLLDETHLAGSYDFRIPNYSNRDELFKLMHDELGLAVIPAQRSVTVLTVKSVATLHAAM